MITYDMICPACGHRNMAMYLEETNGWMECEKCRALHQFTHFRQTRRSVLLHREPRSITAVPVRAGG